MTYWPKNLDCVNVFPAKWHAFGRHWNLRKLTWLTEKGEQREEEEELKE